MAGQPISGHVFRYEGKRRPTWRAKYRLSDGRQVQTTIGPAWTARGCPPAGYWTKRTAEAWLRRLLVEAAAGTLPGMVRTGATVADACAEYLRYIDQDRQRKPSTLRDYDSIFRNTTSSRRSATSRSRTSPWSGLSAGPPPRSTPSASWLTGRARRRSRSSTGAWSEPASSTA
jgi:hypothetical protein